jgi:hypothetical protein
MLALAVISAVAGLLALPPAYLNGDQDPLPNEPRAQPVASTMPAISNPASTTTKRPMTTQRPTTTMSAAAAADSIWASVETNPEKFDRFNDIGYAFIVPRSKRIMGGPPGKDCGQFHPWTVERGGVPAQSTFLRLVLQGKESNAVLLSSMRARIVERRAPLVGTPLICGGAAGGADIHFIHLDLDKRPALGVHAELDDTMQVVARKPFGFTLKRNETEVFDIWAITEKCYCKWVIELELVVNGRQAVKTVTNSGRPFATTAWSGSGPAYHWSWGAWYLNMAGDPLPRNRPLKPLS